MNKKPTSLAFGIVVANLLLGHFFAPIGMMLTPIVLIIVTIIIIFMTANLKPIYLTLLTFGLIVLNDIGLKLYAGGHHDNEGLSWMQLLFLLGLIPSYGILIFGILRTKKVELAEKIISIIFFPILIVGYLYLFNDLGLGRYYWYNWN